MHRTECGILIVSAFFAFVMMIQWLAGQYAPNFVGYFLVFFMAFLIVQGSMPDWLADLIRRNTAGAECSENEVNIMASYRMVNVVFANWSIWLLCSAMDVFTLTFLRLDHPVEFIISLMMVIATILFFFGRRFLMSSDFPYAALVVLYGSYYGLCILPVSYNNAILGTATMTAFRQVYYIYVCILYYYLVAPKNRTTRSSAMVATTHMIYPLYGHWSVLVVGVIPTVIMSYMAARKIRPATKRALEKLRNHIDQIRRSKDIFDIGAHENTVLEEESAEDALGNNTTGDYMQTEIEIGMVDLS